MRLQNNIIKLGYFWLPNNPKNKIAGILSIKDGGDITLEVAELFDNSSKALAEHFNGKSKIDRIIGEVEEYGLVTLDNCFYTSFKLPFNNMVKNTIVVNSAFLGVEYTIDEEPSFNSFKFSIEGMEEWIAASGIDIDYDANSKKLCLIYEPQKTKEIKLNDDIYLEIIFNARFSNSSIFKDVSIEQKVYFNIISLQPASLDKLTSIIYKFTNLICFALDTTVSLESVLATINRVDDEKTREVAVFYSSLPFAKNPAKIKRNKMLFSFRQEESRIVSIINNWFNAYEEIDTALNLYFAAKNGAHKYYEGRFLSLVQGLETYHRRVSNKNRIDKKEFTELEKILISCCPDEHKSWLENGLKYSNEVSLRNRIKSILEDFKGLIGSSKEISSLVNDIVNTRNYLTHYSKNSEEKAIKGIDLYRLSLKVEAVFQFHILKRLGFSKPEIENIFNNNYLLKSKLGIED